MTFWSNISICISYQLLEVVHQIYLVKFWNIFLFVYYKFYLILSVVEYCRSNVNYYVKWYFVILDNYFFIEWFLYVCCKIKCDIHCKICFLLISLVYILYILISWVQRLYFCFFLNQLPNNNSISKKKKKRIAH